MRFIQTLLLLADLLALIVLSVPRLGATRWLRHSPAAALVIAVAQVFVEGARWQMLPAYVLTGLLFLVSMLNDVVFAGRHAGRGWPRRLAVALGSLGLAISGALPVIIPVFRFPHPTGPYAIGTLTYHWVDAARADIFTVDPNARRELMVQVWYPAEAGASSTPAPYMQEADAVTAALRASTTSRGSSSASSSTSRRTPLLPCAWPMANPSIRSCFSWKGPPAFGR